ncbi:Fe-S cluster assembly protein HesB [Bacillus benzoevorans]|uniref:Fe-S cluster assembly iron-binding protein IscA n=1 Tax=Bacillus benzoevorans TaxID=1456 RepID=A0A7X0HPA5_9BACI|nr:Fe-S cluster assembly protein HesB [Bacillus benzoevorans]MBB6444480.1 Fe-S cluster assembly iron-binding protein IscA [Bacillus benzoevorans]
MNITEKAKEYIEQTMKVQGVSTLRFYGINGCCSVKLGIALQKAEENDILEDINGINIAIQPGMKEQLSSVVIEAEEEDGEIFIVLNGYENTSCC